LSRDFSEHDALYVITLRDNKAEIKLRAWVKTSQHNLAEVDGHRLRLFDHNTWSRFFMTWQYGFEQLTVWDNWNRRHIDVVK
jgi:hypothetical protein